MNPQTLNLLVISLAVVVTGTPITQYATFEDLDMLGHVGVLAKGKDGIIWVIHNNGKGTYSMTWDEYRSKWGLHRLKISEWIDSVNGTTVEGAVGVGSPKHPSDVFLDNGYHARDAIVRYLSGGNDRLNIMAVQTCLQGKRYCGHDPEAQAMEMTIGLINQRQKILISCGQNSRISRIDICPGNCLSRGGKPGHALCECISYKQYCGHQLADLGGWVDDSIYRDTLYLCLDGINVTTVQRCTNGCLATEKNSVCGEYCTPNRSYCGYKLNQFGWTGYDPKVVYRCEASGQSAIAIANCSEECAEADDGYALCKCHPGRMYCVYELVIQMNWLVLKDYERTRPHQTLKCLPEMLTGDSIGFALGFNCGGSTCIASQGEKDAYCQLTPGVYCGRTLNIMEWTGLENDTLYQYGEEARNVTVISMCRNGTCQGNGCDCIPNGTYCGHQLKWMGWRKLASDKSESVMQCKEDGTAVQISSCNKCTNSGGHARCAGCAPNRSYCGWKLLEMGLKGYDSSSVHRCEASGQSASSIANCSEGCVESEENDGFAFCQCHPGRIYCMHELVTQMNWFVTIDYNRTRHHQTVKCIPEKSAIILGFMCNTCIGSHGEKGAHCQWTPGVYCGRELNAMGWLGHANDTLYQCGEEENNTSIISMCRNGKCKGSTCQGTCIPNRTYCGHQLYLMGWSSLKSEEMLAILGQCVKGGDDVDLITYCERCTSSEGHVRCVCKDTELYCGHELDAHLPYGDNALYRCNNGGEASLVKTCKRSCVRVEREPFCQGECFPGDTYCGSRLLTLGYAGYNNNSIYSCATDGQNFNDTGKVDSLCIQCTPGQSYCGHQLRQNQYVRVTTLQVRYECQMDGSFKSAMSCVKCISSSTGAYCQCIPGQFFCGFQINSIGWNDFDKTFHLHSNFTDDTLFRCTQKQKIEFVEQCPNKQCMAPSAIGFAFCLCTPHRTYCGHQLNPYYNSQGTYLFTNYIYQCLENQHRVVPINKCGSTCVSVNGEPQCLQQCVHGSRYCGSDFLRLEGWPAMESDVLYECTNGSFASPELNCTQGCRGKNGDVDAYCLGMPTPWYWILLASGLTLLFISLCLGFIRTIIKHRRLQKFVRQHRINASQLTLVLKLGHGQFGEVWHARYTEQISSGQQMDVAVKISKHHLNTSDGQNLASANCFFQESVALDFLRHQNITRALGICSNLKMAGGITTPALVLEYMDGGNSADYVVKEREHLMTSDLMRIFTDICQAGEHLQKMGVIHRDIGARNVLIHKNPRNGKLAVAKLTDFGLAKDVGKAGIYKSTIADRAMFHQGYTAPEGFRGEFSSQSDVWSFGVFMWELYMLMDRSQTEPLVPYSDIPSQAVLQELCNGYRLRRPMLVPNDICSTMTACWAWMPESRPTFRQLRKRLQSKRSANVMEPAVELEADRDAHVTSGGEPRDAVTAFSEQSAPNTGYGSPRDAGDVELCVVTDMD